MNSIRIDLIIYCSSTIPRHFDQDSKTAIALIIKYLLGDILIPTVSENVVRFSIM